MKRTRVSYRLASEKEGQAEGCNRIQEGDAHSFSQYKLKESFVTHRHDLLQLQKIAE